MDIIIYGHLERPGQWMADQINEHPPLNAQKVVTCASDYVQAARELQQFCLVIGQFKLNEYLQAEALLSEENIFPHRRIICAPVVTTQFLEWASSNHFDSVIDLVAQPAQFGKHVADAVCAPKGDGQANIAFPINNEPLGLVYFNDGTDQDIVQLITFGFTNQQIAERVNLSIQTVRNRISRLLEVSGARNRTHLCSMYLIPHVSYNPLNGLPSPTFPSETSI